jgi:hypothetical protein
MRNANRLCNCSGCQGGSEDKGGGTHFFLEIRAEYEMLSMVLLMPLMQFIPLTPMMQSNYSKREL